MEKTLNDYWVDWERHVFGFGYGSGEPHTIPALRRFFETCKQTDRLGSITYDYRELESALGTVPAWLMINTLCGADLVEYGSSPRFAWLTDKGRALRSFMLEHSADELLQMLDKDEGYPWCEPDSCNCGPDGYDPKRKCANPFW